MLVLKYIQIGQRSQHVSGYFCHSSSSDLSTFFFRTNCEFRKVVNSFIGKECGYDTDCDIGQICAEKSCVCGYGYT